MTKRDAAAAGIALGGGHTRVGHPDNHVGAHGSLLSEQLAHSDTGAVKLLAVQAAVGTSEVDELEQAKLGLYALSRPGVEALAAVGAYHEHLAGLHLPDKVGAGDIERRSLGGQDPPIVQFPEAQRPKTVRVPHAYQVRAVSEDQ